MPIEVLDYRRDVRNVLVSPTMRGRFLRHEPGERGPHHSHDVGDELFLILEGRCEFTIEGDVAVLGPGQLCVARAHERHHIRVVGDEPMVMFLAVAPHLEPTHTFYDEDGDRLPPAYNATTAAEHAAVTDRPSPAAQVAELRESLADVTSAATSAEGAVAGRADDLGAAGDEAKAALDEVQAAIGELHARLHAMAATWNDLAARIYEGSPRQG